jgi:hypothetical protein
VAPHQLIPEYWEKSEDIDLFLQYLRHRPNRLQGAVIRVKIEVLPFVFMLATIFSPLARRYDIWTFFKMFGLLAS